MTINQKIEAIIATARANGLKLNQNFSVKYLTENTCYDEPQKIADKAVDCMCKLCRDGINGEFDSGLKRSIDKLSDIVIELTEVKSTDFKKLNKIENECIRLSTVRPYVPNVNAVIPVKEYIENSIRAIETALEFRGEGGIFENIDDRQVEKLNESKEKFQEMLARLNDIFDVSSVWAADKAWQMIVQIEAWRNDCLAFMCTSASLGKLSFAAEILEQWIDQKIAVDKRSRAKSVPQYDGGDLAVLADSKSALETLSTFRNRVESERKAIDRAKAELNENHGRYKEILKNISELENEKMQVAIRLKNDRDEAKAIEDFASIKEKIASLENEANRIKDYDLEGEEEHIALREDILDNLMSVYRLLERNRGDVVFLSEAVEEVDFNELVRAMSANISVDTDKALNSIREIRVYAEMKLEKLAEVRNRIKREREVAQKAFGKHENRSVRVEQKTKEDNGGLDPELVALMAKLDGEQPEKVENEENDMKDPRKIVHIGDDK